jgi:hypothetical protein
MFNLVKTLYCVRHAITSKQVWAYADAGTITEVQALSICGPRKEK